MIILVGASSGLGVKILPKLLQIDDVLAIYNKKKVIKIKNKKKLYIEKVNISDENSIKKIVKKYEKKLYKVTCLNLAAITLDELVINIKKTKLKKIFEINTFSNIFFAKYLIPTMIKQGYGRFIHFSSSKALMGDAGIIGYAASKSSLIGISNSLSKEYGRFGITSNIISLGYFDSNLWTRLKTEKRNKLLQEVPSKSLGSINNISNTIHNIIKSDYLNGATIKLDGGL